MTAAVILTHLALVVAALVFAVAAGVPLGVVCHFYPGARRVILRVVDFIQTTPALALLGFIMITPLGAGKPTVIVGLALYSLLPIVRNTCLGLDQVPAYLVEAGRGMGMTRRYRLFHVEMPLAAPIIFTGIRIAAVNAIGTAVFASFVGGGGLGSFLTTAIRQRDMATIFLGVLIALLGVLSYILIPDFKGEINKDSKLFSLADALEAVKTPGVIWACLAYFAVYCVYQGATYTTPYLTAMGADPNMVNVAGLIRTYGIGLLAGPVLGVIAARIKSTKTILGCFVMAIVVLGVFIVLPQDTNLAMVALALVVVFGFFTYGAFSIGSSPLSELGIPMRIFGTASGLLSVIGFVPDVFIHTWYGSMIDASGTAAYDMIFGFEIMFAVFGIVMLIMCLRTVKKHAAANAANAEN